MKKISIFMTAIVLFAFASNIALAQGEISRITLTSGNSGDSIKVDSAQTATWETSNFPKNAQVSVNLIKKVADSPAKYELVRQIAKTTPNDGSETWKPLRSDVGDNLFIEIGCANSSSFKDGCVADASDAKFAVKGTIGSNIAGVFEAFMNFIGSIFGK